jgi:hypothetical protein
MNRTAVRTALIGLLWLPLAAFAGLKEDMIALDRAYIPALAVTSQGTLEESQRAMALLNKQWAEFKQKHTGSLPKDKQWKSDLAKIDGMVAEANKIVASGKDLAKAHEALEGLRFTMADARKRAKMSYFLDGLTHFHEPMEAIVLTAKDKTPANFDDAEMKLIKDALAEAEKVWGVVRKTKIDAEYGFSDAQRETLAKLIANESQALETLKKALAANDKAAVIKAAGAIKPPFAKTFMSFGNFEPVRQQH